MKTNAQKIVRDALVRIKIRNPSFSNNALAKSVGVTSGFMSKFLNGKKGLSVLTALNFSRALNLSETEKTLLLESVEENVSTSKSALEKARNVYTLEEDQQIFLSQWYYIAIADLARCHNYQHNPQWISQQFKISKLEAEEALQRLIRMKIIVETKPNKWTKKNSDMQIITTKSQAFIREFHKQMMNKAIQHMESETTTEAFKMRSIRGRTLAINPKKIEPAKKLIQSFLNDMENLLEDGPSKQVYQLNLQLFPLSTNKVVSKKEGDSK